MAAHDAREILHGWSDDKVLAVNRRLGHIGRVSATHYGALRVEKKKMLDKLRISPLKREAVLILRSVAKGDAAGAFERHGRLKELMLGPDVSRGRRVKRQKVEWARKGREGRQAEAQQRRMRWEVKAQEIIAARPRRRPSYRELAIAVAKVTGDKTETIRKYFATRKIVGN